MAITDFSGVVAGLALPEIAIEVDRLAIVKYCGGADDYVRQHWDHPFMIDQGYPDVIGHGWLTMAHMCRVVTDWAPPSIATISRYMVRYQKPFHPGLLRCGASVTACDGATVELALWGRGVGDAVLATGTATVVLR